MSSGELEEPVAVGHHLQHALAFDLPGEVVLGDDLLLVVRRTVRRFGLGMPRRRFRSGPGGLGSRFGSLRRLRLAAPAFRGRFGRFGSFGRARNGRGGSCGSARRSGRFRGRSGRRRNVSGYFGRRGYFRGRGHRSSRFGALRQTRAASARSPRLRGRSCGFTGRSRLCVGGSGLFRKGRARDRRDQFAFLSHHILDAKRLGYFAQFGKSFTFERFQILHICSVQ